MKRVIVVAAAFGVAAWMAIAGSLAAAATPRWVRHVQRYPGGISNGVRAYTDSGLQRAQAASKFRSPSVAPVSSQSSGSLQNLQVNTDSNPPLPQNETQIAHSVYNDKVAVGGGERLRERRLADLRAPPTADSPGRPRSIVGGRGDGRLLRRRRRSGGDLQPARPRFLLRAAVLLPRLPAVGDRGDPVHRQREDLDGVAHGLYPISNFSPKLNDFNPALFYDKDQITVDNNRRARTTADLRHLHQVPHAAQRVQRLLPGAGRLHGQHRPERRRRPDRRGLAPHRNLTRQPGRQRQGPVGQPGRAAGRGQPGRPGHLVHDRGVQHVARPRHLLQAVDQRRRELRCG